MTQRDDDLRVRLGRIRDRGHGSRRPDTFIGEVMRAARKARHTGRSFGKAAASKRSTFGRGRGAALSLSHRSSGRRVVVTSRIVRHRGFRSPQS